MQINPDAALRFSGAVALNPKPSAGSVSAPPSDSPWVLDVTDATLQAEVLDRSLTTPVVLDLWAVWCGPCKQLSPVLERLADAYQGAWVLAKVDVDANPQISQALQVQSIPTIFGVVAGRVVPLFQGALPEAQVRAYLDKFLELAREAGLAVAPAEGGQSPAAPVGPALDPDLVAGDEALDRGDLDAAQAAYQALLERKPADPDAVQALARIALLRRVDATPADELGGQLRDADLLVLQGQAEEAVAALLTLLRATPAAERDPIRRQLLSLFELFGPGEQITIDGRRKLSAALF